MDKVRFGVIGCAGIASKAFLPALKSSAWAEPVMVASLCLEEAQQCADEFGCEAVDGYDDLLARGGVDAIYIATPIGLHAEWAMAAAQAGCHVLCEKSLARDVEETRHILEACELNGVALFEGFTYQFHTQHAAVRAAVDEGRVGEPVLFQAWFGFPPLNDDNFRYVPELGGGALLDAGAYTVHMARRFFGREPVRAHGCLHHGNRRVDIRGSALLDFGAGQTAQLAFGFDNVYRNSYAVWGTKGQVTLSRAFSIPPSFAATLILEQQGYREEQTLKPFDQFAAEIEGFCRGLNNPQTRTAWREDALAQALALEMIRLSDASESQPPRQEGRNGCA